MSNKGFNGKPNSSPNVNNTKKPSINYLKELLRDQQQLINFPDLPFQHIPNLLEEEIVSTRKSIFHDVNENDIDIEVDLPQPTGEIVTLLEKVFIPIDDNPAYNFVGRILGPGGMTAKHMEQVLGCKIMIRGKGCMRDKKKEERFKSRTNWGHLNEDLHVLLSVKDFESRAAIRMKKVVTEIKKFLDEAIQTPENEDKLKQMQLMELAARNQANKNQFLLNSCNVANSWSQPPMLGLNSGIANPYILHPGDVNSNLIANQFYASTVNSAGFEQRPAFNPFFQNPLPVLDPSLLALSAMHKPQNPIINSSNAPVNMNSLMLNSSAQNIHLPGGISLRGTGVPGLNQEGQPSTTLNNGITLEQSNVGFVDTTSMPQLSLSMVSKPELSVNGDNEACLNGYNVSNNTAFPLVQTYLPGITE